MRLNLDFGGPILVYFLKKINRLNMILTFETQIIRIFSQIITIDLKSITLNMK